MADPSRKPLELPSPTSCTRRAPSRTALLEVGALLAATHSGPCAALPGTKGNGGRGANRHPNPSSLQNWERPKLPETLMAPRGDRHPEGGGKGDSSSSSIPALPVFVIASPARAGKEPRPPVARQPGSRNKEVKLRVQSYVWWAGRRSPRRRGSLLPIIPVLSGAFTILFRWASTVL